MGTRRQRQVFSIVSNRELAPAPGGDDDLATRRHRELLAAIARIGEGPPASVSEDEIEEARRSMEDYRSSMEHMLKLKAELDQIHDAINRTKREIAGLHQSGISGDNLATVTNELDAVVDGTEQATENILAAAEEIDRNAADLAASLKQSRNRDQANEIQEHVIQIFESCNFQDLTGQRITKVVNTLKYVEERVDAMMGIWGGLDAFSHIKAAPMPNPAGDHELLHGPGDNAADPTRASQDDIDALFD